MNHDSLFKATFADPVHAAALLRGILPPELVAVIDWSTLKLLPGNFIDPALRQRLVDLLFSVLAAGVELLIYVVFEHRSHEDPLTAFHVNGYVQRVRERHVAEHPEAVGVPIVLPVVLFHGPATRVPRELRRLVDLRSLAPGARRAVLRWQPQLRFLLINVSAFDEHRIRALTDSAMASLALLCMRYVRGASPDEAVVAIRRWSDLWLAVAAAPNGIHAAATLCSYILQTTAMQVPLLEATMRPLFEPGPDELPNSTWAQMRIEAHEHGLALGREQGLEEGYERGLERGQEQGRRAAAHVLLQRLLIARFGPDGAAVRIPEGASFADLERWLERTVTAPSLAAVFAAP